MTSVPDYKGFARAVMEAWPEGEIDGFQLQDLAEKYSLIVEVEGGFDPKRHVDVMCDAKPGDRWFERNYRGDEA